jgi:hypothetical protein
MDVFPSPSLSMFPVVCHVQSLLEQKETEKPLASQRALLQNVYLGGEKI